MTFTRPRLPPQQMPTTPFRQVNAQGPLSRPSPQADGHQASPTIATTPSERPLTSGEIAMARVIFKDAIRYGNVRIHKGSYFPFGWQSKGTAVAPNGSIYFLEEDYLGDFSLGTAYDKRWLIHELTHVWQYQLGYPVRLRGAFRIGLSYDYVLEKGKRLGDYNMEAQGDILADYFALVSLNKPDIVHNRIKGQAPSLKDYEDVLQDFLADPKDTKNLP